MNKEMKNNIANYITIGRIILTLILLYVKPLSVMFYILYIACGLSDMLDGYIARRLKIQSTRGAILDSIADFLFMAVVLIRILPIVQLASTIWVWAIFIALVKMLAVGINCIKFNTLGMLHTYLNKLVGFMLFISPLLLKVVSLKLICISLCILASIACIEEFIIDVSSKNLNLDKKGLFFKD